MCPCPTSFLSATFNFTFGISSRPLTPRITAFSTINGSAMFLSLQSSHHLSISGDNVVPDTLIPQVASFHLPVGTFVDDSSISNQLLPYQSRIKVGKPPRCKPWKLQYLLCHLCFVLLLCLDCHISYKSVSFLFNSAKDTLLAVVSCFCHDMNILQHLYRPCSMVSHSRYGSVSVFPSVSENAWIVGRLSSFPNASETSAACAVNPPNCALT